MSDRKKPLTLAAAAKAVKPSLLGKKKYPEDQIQELAVEWVNSRVTTRQAMVALGVKSAASISFSFSAALRRGVAARSIKVTR